MCALHFCFPPEFGILCHNSQRVASSEFNISVEPNGYQVYSRNYNLLCYPNRSPHRSHWPDGMSLVVGADAAPTIFGTPYTHFFSRSSPLLAEAESAEDYVARQAEVYKDLSAHLTVPGSSDPNPDHRACPPFSKLAFKYTARQFDEH